MPLLASGQSGVAAYDTSLLTLILTHVSQALALILSSQWLRRSLLTLILNHISQFFPLLLPLIEQ